MIDPVTGWLAFVDLRSSLRIYIHPSRERLVSWQEEDIPRQDRIGELCRCIALRCLSSWPRLCFCFCLIDLSQLAQTELDL